MQDKEELVKDLEKQKKKEKILAFVIKLSVSLIIGLSFFIGLYFGRTRSLIDVVNGFFIGGAFLIGVAGLSVVTRYGSFDTFAYAFSTLGYKYIPNVNRKYEDLYDYKQKKNEKRIENRFSYLPYLVAGIILVLIALICYFILLGTSK